MTEYSGDQNGCLDICLVDFDWEGHHTPYASLLARYLVCSNHNVTFVTAPNHDHLDEFERIEGLDVVTLRKTTVTGVDGGLSALKNQASRLIQMAECIYQIRNRSFDIIHLLAIDYQEIPFNIFTLLKTLFESPVAVTLHRDHFLDRDGNFKREFRNKLAFKSIKIALESGALQSVVVHNDQIRRRLGNIIDIDALCYAPCPTADLTTNATKAEARAELQLPPNGPIFLFFGELRREKGLDLFIAASSNLKQRGPFTVVIAGPEVDYSASEIDDLIPNNTDAEILNRSGFVPQELVDLYFVAADALVLPYRRRKGISGPLRIACMANIHIIGPAESDIGNIIEANDLGQTFELGSQSSLLQAMNDYLQNAERYPTAGVRKYRQRVHWKTAGMEFETLYHQLIADRGYE